MKWFILLQAWFVCFILTGCLTEYEAKGVKKVNNILVVEGLVTEGESIVLISRSIDMSATSSEVVYENNARVYVECEDGTQTGAEPETEPRSNGRYVIKTGKLNFERKYRLKIEIEENIDNDCKDSGDNKTPCPKGAFVYCSDYSYPINTPEIDSVFWTKRGKGQQVTIHVATHDQENRVLYYRWSYEEDWEIHPDLPWRDYYYPDKCWRSYKNIDMLLGSNEKTVFGKVTDILTEMNTSNWKLKVLYRLTVKQNAISKRAFDYYSNIQKNIQETSDIFTPIPSELRGNIVCITDPDRPVIGYADFSLTTQQTIFIRPRDGAYEMVPIPQQCEDEKTMPELIALYLGPPPDFWVPYYWRYTEEQDTVLLYIIDECIDCTRNGVTQKPDNWPNN